MKARRLLHRRLIAALLPLVLLIASAAAPTAASAAGNRFYAGYCTWLAAEMAYDNWGLWVPWLGDAWEWSAAAQANGFTVSDKPSEGSIVVMPPYVQGASAQGHVGWVVGVDPDGSAVTVRSMNWRGWNQITIHTVAVDGRVRFITPP